MIILNISSALCSSNNLQRFSLPFLVLQCSGVYRRLSWIFTSALCSSNNLPMFSLPFKAHQRKAVCPPLSWIFTSALCSSNNLQMFSLPFKAQPCKGVHPALSWIFTFALCLSNNLTRFSWPLLAETCSGVNRTASIREGRVALSVGHPRGTHSRYVIGCCLISFGIYGLKNNLRRITYGIGCVWGMPSLFPLSSLVIAHCLS